MICARSSLGNCSSPPRTRASNTLLPVRRSGKERTFDDSSSEEDVTSAIGPATVFLVMLSLASKERGGERKLGKEEEKVEEEEDLQFRTSL